MKSLAITIALGALALIGAAPTAEAGGYGRHHGHHQTAIYISGYQSCGTPIYTERFVIRVDRRGYPVWGHRPVRHHYRPPVHHYRPPVVVAPCPPPVYGRPVYGRPVYGRPVYGGSYGHGGIHIHGTFRR